MLKLLAQHGTSRRLSEVREEDPVTATQLKRLGVDYGKADAETLVHFLRYASELQEGMAIHDNEFPAIIWSRKKYGAKAILRHFNELRENDREVVGHVIVRFEYQMTTRWVIMSYLDTLKDKIKEAREDADSAFSLNRSDPLFHTQEFADARRAQRVWEEVRDVYQKLLMHFPNRTTMN